ncbi:DUF3105 domain-containing protein [Streptomyces sp. TRM66268-LWL]|uniref:DUF3105 domain-containing protein n=1 Tax=Streptomyces polyasparticus TaxID=2767826 RepID=A0ABR7SBQ5_9ACTN|nr:DUF3105 domain-containing protein [Streptomyces polyasparticus]MBC9712412.1 DUF3105 domain-containing protein [Streptomyces polyasparticus]
MGSARQNSSADRRARIEEMRRAEQARERRNRLLTIGISTVIVVGLVGFGSYLFISEQNKQDEADAKAKAAADAPIKGLQEFDAKKLGRNHVTKPVSYPQTPPVGGDHNQVWMNCNGDVYDKAIPDMNAVHSLEHGAVWVTYNKQAKDADVKALAEKVKATPYSLMSPVDGQEGALMLTAWGKQVTVDSAKDPRVESFFAKFVQGKQTPELGAACTNGLAG